VRWFFVLLDMSASRAFIWQLHRTECIFTNRGNLVPCHFGLSLSDGDEVELVVFVHDSDWCPDKYARFLSEQLQKVLKDSNTQQQLQQLLSTGALAAACRSSCHAGGKCSCHGLGPFKARLSPKRSGQLQLLGIQHGRQLARYRPEPLNHDLLLMVQVRFVLGFMRAWSLLVDVRMQCSAVLAFLLLPHPCQRILQDGLRSLQLHIAPKGPQSQQKACAQHRPGR
jgi:hypothetical protein